MRACAFTGHRKIEDGHYSRLIDLLTRGIEYVYNEGVRDFYIGGAVGFDTLAAKAVVLFRMLHKDVTLNLVLPCLNQSARWSSKQQDMYDYLLSEADSVEYLSDVYYNGCMRVRNQRLVDLSDCLIAYVSEDAHSGSMQTKRMAEKAGLVVYNLYPSCRG